MQNVMITKNPEELDKINDMRQGAGYDAVRRVPGRHGLQQRWQAVFALFLSLQPHLGMPWLSPVVHIVGCAVKLLSRPEDPGCFVLPTTSGSTGRPDTMTANN